jgi:hypothetical protein
MSAKPTGELAFVGVKVEPAVRDAIDRARKGKRISDFVREALKSECAKYGVDLPDAATAPRDRAGVGGRKKRKTKPPAVPATTLRYPPHQGGHYELNASTGREKNDAPRSFFVASGTETK